MEQILRLIPSSLNSLAKLIKVSEHRIDVSETMFANNNMNAAARYNYRGYQARRVKKNAGEIMNDSKRARVNIRFHLAAAEMGSARLPPGLTTRPDSLLEILI